MSPYDNEREVFFIYSLYARKTLETFQSFIVQLPEGISHSKLKKIEIMAPMQKRQNISLKKT